MTVVVIYASSGHYVQTLKPGRNKACAVARDLNVFFAAEGLAYVAKVEDN